MSVFGIIISGAHCIEGVKRKRTGKVIQIRIFVNDANIREKVKTAACIVLYL